MESRVVDRLPSEGHEVIGLNAITGNHPWWMKERDLAGARRVRPTTYSGAAAMRSAEIVLDHNYAHSG